MIQKYTLTIEGTGLPPDLSKDLAKEIDCECFVGVKIQRIKVEKMKDE